MGFVNTRQSTASTVAELPVYRFDDRGARVQSDALAVEEPLEIRLGYTEKRRRKQVTVSVTMRTPGHDLELALGFLFTEGIISNFNQALEVTSSEAGNMVQVDLRPDVPVDLQRLERHCFTASSCGVCGKASLEAIRVSADRLCFTPQASDRPLVDVAVIQRLPETLWAAQVDSASKGTLHTAALFDVHGILLDLREDVGHHNALDKLLGAAFLAEHLPLTENILVVSGRASFELVQKAAVAGIPIVASMGPPSSLAVELARDQGLTLIRLYRSNQFDIFTGPERIDHVEAWQGSGANESSTNANATRAEAPVAVG